MTSPYNYKQVFSLALPMILSNISTPLLGMIDTVVMGHLDNPRFLGGTAVGGLIFNFIYWGFGFLRMGTTGVTAQAFGNRDDNEVKAIFMRALLLAVGIAIGLLLLQYPVRFISFRIISSTPGVETLAATYFDIRIWSAPATLSLYAILGWFLGIQDVKSPLLIVLAGNIVNIVLDIVFVVALQMGISGVALASVLADYTALLLGMLLVSGTFKRHGGVWSWFGVLDRHRLKKLLLINNNILIRTLCLIFVFAFFTARGAQLGEVILAANAVLLNFLVFTAYALDGIAHAAEALVGRALGAADRTLFTQTIKTAAISSLLIAVGFSGCYQLSGTGLINMLTSLEPVRAAASRYLPWLVITPFVSFGCYLLDGIFIGATLSKEMRNTMLFSTACCFLPAWYFTRFLHNHGLWLALCLFFLARTLSMAWILHHKKTTLFASQSG